MSAGPKPYRVPCEVEGCRRTCGSRTPNAWWICPTHWALVPKAMRRVLTRHKRRKTRLGFHPSQPAVERVVARVMHAAGAAYRPGCQP